MDKQLSSSFACDEDVGKETRERQTDVLKEGETSAHCQRSDTNEVGEETETCSEQHTKKCTRTTFSDPDSELLKSSVDNKAEGITTSNIDVEQRRVSRRDEHERTLQQQHSHGQLDGGLHHTNKKEADDIFIKPSQNQV